MQKRSVAAVIILTLFTFGIYSLVWHVKTKGEMVREGADIPTAWLLIIPLAHLYWYWKWCGGVESAPRGGMSEAVISLLSSLLGVIASPITQDSFNKVIDPRLP